MSGPLDYTRRPAILAWLAVVGLFLYAPLILMAAFSFNAGRRITQWRGFTLDWYGRVFSDPDLLLALGNSLLIAAAVTAASLLLGALAALALWRPFRGRAALDAAFALPIVAPEICLGVGSLLLFARLPNAVLPWPLDLAPIVAAHTAFAFPFVAVVARARLASLDPALLEAARDLGAGSWRALFDVALPHLRPALVAGGLLAFILSLDDFVVTFFTAGPATVTFPVKLYSMLRFSVTPQVNAVSTLLLLFTVALTWGLLRAQAKAERA